MTYKEHKLFWRRLKVVLIMTVLCFVVIGARFFLAPQVEEGIAEAQTITNLDSKVSSTRSELESLNYSIENSGKAFVDLADNKDNYVRALGLLCDANSLNIHKMTVDDIISESNGISSMSVVLELQGDLSDVRDFVSDIYSSEMLCRINSVSYRLEGDTFSWMWRAIDDNDVVSWWDISDVDDYLLEDPDVEIYEEDMELLDASAFMKHGTALCYLEVQFIGTED